MNTRKIVLALIAATPTIFAAGIVDSEQVTKLLTQARTEAFQLKDDAATMESFKRMNVSRETQAVTINQIKDHVNALTRLTAALKESEPIASPWQKKVIKGIDPFLQELGGYTSAVIEHLSGEVHHNFAEYQDYLEANLDYSTDLVAMINDYLNYGKTKDRLEDLTNKLEIPNE